MIPTRPLSDGSPRGWGSPKLGVYGRFASMRAPSSRNRAGNQPRFGRDPTPLPFLEDEPQERSTSRGTAPLSFSALPLRTGTGWS